ncbi:MAG TPA: beta-propeller domain-containing protein [Polyangiales bacterium]|nr:beta-propeller domain-containing protein [Polyangiales bacterium]
MGWVSVRQQIFDVSDMQDPKLTHKTTIGTRGTSSEALANHLAFTLFKDKLALPMTICEGGTTQGGPGTDMTFSGLMVFDVSVNDGINERGRIEHPMADGSYDNKACSNWWTNASSVVQRSVFMDNFVYSIANDVMRIQDLNTLGTDVTSVSLNR